MGKPRDSAFQSVAFFFRSEMSSWISLYRARSIPRCTGLAHNNIRVFFKCYILFGFF